MKAKLLNAINKQTGELCGNPHIRYYGTELVFTEPPQKGQSFTALSDLTGSGIKSSPVISVANVGNLWRVETENTRYLWEVKG